MDRPGPPPDLAALMAALAEGDRQAWSELYVALAPMVAATALRVLRSRDLVQDVVQEVFLDLERSARRFRRPAGGIDGDRAVRNWAVGITVKTALYLARTRNNRLRRELAAGGTARPAPAGPAEAVALRDLLAAGLAELPPHLATAVGLHYLEGLSYAEIGASEGISAANAKRRAHRGIQHLRTWCARGGIAAGLSLITGTLRAAPTTGAVPVVGAALPAAAAQVPVHILHGGLSTMTTLGLAAAGVALATGISIAADTQLLADDDGPRVPAPAPAVAVAEAPAAPGPGRPVGIGTVAAVRADPQGGPQNLVMITFGKGDRPLVGDSLIVYRDNRYICKVTVARVFEDMTACRVDQASWNTGGWVIALGDQVAARLF